MIDQASIVTGRSSLPFYVVGGTLLGEAPCYVVRRADDELHAALVQGRFCYVLTSRQMGKSSLMVRTAVRLREEGVGVAVLDLTAVGQNLSPEQWYDGLVSLIADHLDLEDELEGFWAGSYRLGAMQRWMQAIRDVVLPKYPGGVVIFIDEIDAVRSLPFSTDEFFAGIREFYNRRAEEPELERLTFCLLGVATPSDLIRDTRTTPFNIGQRVELHDFTRAEASPLAEGLERKNGLEFRLLDRVLYWTGGHPYLTQRLCHAIAEDPSVNNADTVDRMCAGLFFTRRAREQDDNLLFVRERMLHGEVELPALLSLYGQVQRHKGVLDDETNPLVSALRLSGIARAKDGDLMVRNRIYERVFDQEWVKANVPDAEMKRQRMAYRRGLVRATAVGLVILAVIAALALTAYRKSNLAHANLLQATLNAEKAQSALDESERQRQIAEDEKAETEQQRQEAVSQRAAAEEQRNLAEERQLDNGRLLYAAHVDLAQQAYETTDIARMDELLALHIPKPEQEDLRGFEWYYLWRLSHKSRVILEHESTVYSVAFSPDGKTIATGGLDETVKLFDLSVRRELPSLQKHGGVVYSVAFSVDGKTLAAASEKTVKLWDVATRQVIGVLAGHADVVRSVTFSPDGKLLATGSNDGTARLWDVDHKEMLKELKGHTDFVSSVMFSPDGATLATGSYDRSAKLWDVATGRERATLSGHINIVNSVAFSPDGKRLVTGSNDETARVWDIAKHETLVTLKGHMGFVLSVIFAPDARTIAAAGTGSTVTIWDVATARELTNLKSHNGTIWSVVFSRDGKILATTGSDHSVRLWEIADDREERAFLGAREGFKPLILSPDGKVLAKRGQEHDTLKLFDVVNRQELGTFKVRAEASSASVALSPRGRILAAGSSDNTMRLWEVATRQELPLLKGDTSSISAVAFSGDSKFLATGNSDGTTKLWEIATGRILKAFRAHSGMIKAVGFSRDGKILASGGPDAVTLWDLTTGRELTTFTGHWVQTWAVAFSPDGTTFATAVHDREVKLWDLTTRHELISLKGHASAVLCIAFSPDGKRVVTGGSDGTVKLWDVATGQARITLKDQNSAITSVSFSADGRTVGSTTLAGGIRLWHAATNKEITVQAR